MIINPDYDEAQLAEKALRERFNGMLEYFDLAGDKVSIDGDFTPEQLRAIADARDDLMKKANEG